MGLLEKFSKICCIKFVDVKFSLEQMYAYILSSRLNGGLCRVNVLYYTVLQTIFPFFRVFYRDGLPPKNTVECDISSVIRKDGIFFPENIIWTENERGYYERSTLSFDIFCMIGKDDISFFLYDIKEIELRQE